MSFIQYCSNNVTVSLKQATSENITFLTLLNADTLFILQTNNTYQIYRIRSSELIHSGELPK